MNAFAALVERLEGTSDEDAAGRILARYLAGAPDPDRGFALAALIGAPPVRRLRRAVLDELAERLDPVLLAISRETVGDAAEAIALMWPAPRAGSARAPSVTEVVTTLLYPGGARGGVERLARWLDALAPSARVALLRLAVGQLAGALPVRVAQAALTHLGEARHADVEAVWHAASPPYQALFAWASGTAPRPPPAAIAPFRPLAPVRAIAADARARLDLGACAVDLAWDGLRVLAVASGRARRLYTRRGVDVGPRFPELLGALPADGAFEGMVVMRDADGRLSRAALETRLAPRRRPRIDAHAPRLLLHDVLAHDGDDLRARSLRVRRDRLAALADALTDGVVLAPLHSADGWDALDRLRTAARAEGAAGVVLKPWDAPYGAEAEWVEWRCEPHRLDAVVLYVDWGAWTPAATVGVWERDALVPLAKVVLADREAAAAVAGYAAETRVDRFGPVEQVAADAERGLVVELAFAGLERAPRRKSGVRLREAHLVRVREDVAPRDAARLDDLRALLRGA